ncbi:MAG: hypothetical protein ABFD97_02890 [Syntrophobacter sp.]
MKKSVQCFSLDPVVMLRLREEADQRDISMSRLVNDCLRMILPQLKGAGKDYDFFALDVRPIVRAGGVR